MTEPYKNKATQKAVQAALSNDPLEEAERLTGLSYKDDELTSAIGLVLHLEATQARKEALRAAGDTYYSMPFEDFADVAAGLGFTIMAEKVFSGSSSGVSETWQLWVKPEEALLLAVDSYRGHVNMANLHYNWVPGDLIPITEDGYPRIPSEVYEVFGSGGLNRNEEDGYIQIRHAQVIDGLAYKLSVLRNWGYFLTPWFNRPWLSIQDHVTSHEVYDQSKTFDQRQLDRAEQDEAALSLLPPEVKALFDAPDH